MSRPLYRSKVMMVAAVLFTVCTVAAASVDKLGTFTLTLSLPSPTMHVGDDLVFEVNTSNSTDQVLFAAQGGTGGLRVELLNEKGEDVGLYAMGTRDGKIEEPSSYFVTRKMILKPNSKHDFTWRLKPVPGYLIPGVYKFRVRQREIKSGSDVYSNEVDLTVLP
jgi:hypothetical protein